MTQPTTCGEMRLGRLQCIPPLQLRIWFHLSNASRDEMPEIALILAACLIGLVCGSVEAARSLEQQIEQLDCWIQLQSLHQIVSGTDTVPIPLQVCSCNCRMVKQFFSLKNIPQFWESSSEQCSFKGRVLSRSLAQEFPCGGGNIQPSSGGCWQGSDAGQKCEQPESCSTFCQEISPKWVFC